MRIGRSTSALHLSRTASASSGIEAGWRVQADLERSIPPVEQRRDSISFRTMKGDHRPMKSCREKRPSAAEADQVPASTSFGRAGSFHAIRSPTKITPVTSVLSESPNMPRLATKSPTAVPAALTMATVSQ
jgi:hypothetical protein